ncbi:MMPL family transporter [Micromonospora deserti]|uniref:MMPL domain-containing protein n=1 Tax=Micromonospora deserti TaxID=2070366 RepID=A0A2W2DBE6_9ACTN|nr:MMPL family transporter [Micromonospora deserti]PZG02555.1 MMPL domain-containing protein [Micromonospora deserti]
MLRTGKSAGGDPGAGPPGSPPLGDRDRETKRTVIERAAGWSVRHPVLAIVGWFTLVAVAVLASALLPGEQARSTDPGESGRAQRVLRQQQGLVPVRESVLIQARQSGGQRVSDDPALRAAVKDLVTSLRRTGAVTDVRSPLEPDGQSLVSADGHSGLVTFHVAGTVDEVRPNYDAAVRAVDAVAGRHPQARLAQAGDRSLAVAVDQGIKDDFKRAEFISLPLTVVILLVVFGSLVAAGIPLLLALSTVAGTFGLLQVVAHWVPINSATSSMVLLIGVAVGIDYSLFYLRRAREERATGRDIVEALRITARTSGHAVVISGLTVMLCLAGLLFTGLDNFRGLTVGAVLVVGLAMTGSVTVLPALLAVLGHRVDSGRIPWLSRRRTAAADSLLWSAVAHAVVRRPLLWGGTATLALVMMALPAFGMRLQDAAVTDSLPRSVPTVDAAIRMQQAFPGAASPARVVIWNSNGEDADNPAVQTAIDNLRSRVLTSGGMLAEPVAVVKVDRVLVMRIPMAGSGTDATSNQALQTLRDDVLPATLGEIDDIDYAVTGRTAIAYDFATTLNSRTPTVFAFVLALAFVLLVVAFRSLAVPFVSVALNLLSIGAAYGVLTWVFQDGHLASVLGFTPYGGVVGWLPLFMFVILFGLSMDYHIFILSRIRERWTAGANPRDAIIGGIASSAGVVTSAAVIMTAVFTIFITLSAIEYKMLGVGMAVAVIIDATIVRGVLLPAAMALLGARTWTLPRWPHRPPGRLQRTGADYRHTPQPTALEPTR